MHLNYMLVETQKYYAQHGITTAQEGASTAEIIQVLQYCQEHNDFIMDIAAYPVEEYASEFIPDQSYKMIYDRHLKIAGAKVIADGSLKQKQHG